MKKSVKIFILVATLISFPIGARADLISSGFTPDSYNGCWVEAGTNNGYPYYTLDTHFMGIISDLLPGEAVYGIQDSLPVVVASQAFNTGSGSPTDDPTSSWQVGAGAGGGYVAGDVDTGTCPTPSPTSSIQYVDNPTQDLFNGYILFLVGLALIMWIMRGRKTH